jgi:sugar diacid utilization regulator
VGARDLLGDEHGTEADAILSAIGSARQHRDLVEAISEVMRAMGSFREEADLLHLIIRKICLLVDVKRCSIFLKDRSTGMFRGKVGHPDDHADAYIRRLICGTPADGFTAEILRRRAPVAIDRVRSDTRPIRSTMRAWNVASMMGVPMILEDEVIGLFFLDTENEIHVFSPTQQTLASLFADLAAVVISQSQLHRTLQKSHDTVARQNKALRRARALDDRLTSLVLEGRNLHEIAAAVADLTQKQCAIYDSARKHLAGAVPASVQESACVTFGNDLFERPELAAALDSLSASDAPAVVGPFPQSGINRRLMLTPVSARDDQWATLVLAEQGGRFSDFDTLIGQRTANVIALEISAGRRQANAAWNAREALSAELLRGSRQTAEVENQAAFLGIQLARPRVVCVLSVPEDDVQPPDARALTQMLPEELDPIATAGANVIAMIVELGAEAGSVADPLGVVREAMEKVCGSLGERGALVGISSVCEGIEDYPGAFVEAREVVECLEQFSREGSPTVMAAGDLGAARRFLCSCDPKRVAGFGEEILGSVLAEAMADDLLVSIAAWFQCDRYVKSASEILGVHENTVRYRLGRIEKLTGLDISGSSEAQWNLQLAILILRLQGRVPALGAQPESEL